MTSLSCTHCGAETTNGLCLCERCQIGAGVYFEFLPVYFRNLSRWRPGRGAGSRAVPGSRVPAGVRLTDDEPHTGTGDRISDRLDEVLTTISRWARTFATDHSFTRPLTYVDAVLVGDLPDDVAGHLAETPAETMRLLCSGLEQHIHAVATFEWSGHLVEDLSRAEKLLREMTEAYVPGWYAGGCRRVINGHRCDAGTYVVPGLTWVTCGVCGSTTYARDHLDTILDEARDWVAPPKRLAEAVVALVDGELSVPNVYARIRKWAERGQIGVHRRNERGYSYDETEDRMVVVDEQVGQARYRFGDVLDRIWSRHAASSREVRAS